MPQDEQLIGFLAFAEEIRARLEHDVAATSCDELDVRLIQVAEEGVIAEQDFKRLDPHAQASSVRRMERTSSVMSMPTGHHVMQRPQPTQPEVPNWSIQVASLWVSHWR